MNVMAFSSVLTDNTYYFKNSDISVGVGVRICICIGKNIFVLTLNAKLFLGLIHIHTCFLNAFLIMPSFMDSNDVKSVRYKSFLTKVRLSS